jgi:hypothetical protein
MGTIADLNASGVRIGDGQGLELGSGLGLLVQGGFALVGPTLGAGREWRGGGGHAGRSGSR